ncbi:MAG: hypothetical protein NZ809_02580 [Thermodesulfovibrio sp.]|nr:hypothetical protein [Thermodesulfovibrio sp.]
MVVWIGILPVACIVIVISYFPSFILGPTVEIKDEQISIREFYFSYAVILAAIPAVAQFIGNAVIGYSIVYYVLSLAGIYISVLIANALAPTLVQRRISQML